MNCGAVGYSDTYLTQHCDDFTTLPTSDTIQFVITFVAIWQMAKLVRLSLPEMIELTTHPK